MQNLYLHNCCRIDIGLCDFDETYFPDIEEFNVTYLRTNKAKQDSKKKNTEYVMLSIISNINSYE